MINTQYLNNGRKVISMDPQNSVSPRKYQIHVYAKTNEIKYIEVPLNEEIPFKPTCIVAGPANETHID